MMSQALAYSYDESPKLTYQDYLDIPEDGKRREIIDGRIYMMAAPRQRHQLILMRLSSDIYVFLKGRRCRVFPAPFDVRLPLKLENSKTATNVVQPDITVFCDPSNLDERGGKGAPDIAVEIISKSSIHMDKLKKFNLYTQAGVKEYWMVDGDSGIVEIFIHDGVSYSQRLCFGEGDIITSTVLEGLEIPTATIFEE